jgi:hypothetical protein
VRASFNAAAKAARSSPVQVNPKAWFWGLNKTVTSIATGAASTTTIPNQSGGDLFIQKLRIKAFLTSIATAIAGTPLNSQGHPTAASGTMAPTTLVTIQLKIGGNQLFQQEVSLFALHGESGDAYEFELVLPKLVNKQDLSWSITNGTLQTISVELFADCIAVPVGQTPFVP